MEDELKRQLAALQEQLAAMQAAASNNPEPPRTNAIKAQLPNFWADKPKCWFAQAEAQFAIAGITQDDTKYGYVISMLDTRIVDEVEDIISNPPDKDKYKNLKTELISRLSTSKEYKVRQLLSEEQLGDRKPSAFLRHLRSLAGTNIGDEGILRELWMRRLPTEVQRILIAQKDLPLEKVAEIADAIVDSPVGLSSRVHAAAAGSSNFSDLSRFARTLDELSKKVDVLYKDRQRSRSKSRSGPNQSRSSSRADGKPKICWYHKKFQLKASKCISPCEWKPENSKSKQ